MKIATATLQSVSTYCQNAPFTSKKSRDETHDEFEKRVWMERAHTDGKGNLIIPPLQFKNALSNAAKYKPVQIKGKGKSTYTKHFKAGVLVLEPLVVAKVGDVQQYPLFIPPDGKTGSGTRVWKYFPTIPEWRGDVVFTILDDIIQEDVFEQTLRDAGAYVGVGSFRPLNNGLFGRFKVEKIVWGK